MKKPHQIKSPIWCCIYHSYEGCWHIEWGQRNGQPIDAATAKNLAESYFKKNEVRRQLRSINMLFPSSYRRFFDDCVLSKVGWFKGDNFRFTKTDW